MTRARFITSAQLYAYLGCGRAAVRRLRKRGLLPDPLPQTRLYDFDAVNRLLDRSVAPGVESSSTEAEARLIEKARRWGDSR